MHFEFYTASKIVFGSGSLKQLGQIASQYGRNFLIVSGGGSLEKRGVLGKLENQLKKEDLAFVHYKGIRNEPEPKTVETGLDVALRGECDAVIAVGGGSVIDTGKAIAGLITNGGPLMDYLEGVGKGKKLTHDPVPFIAIPTTSGTGSEVTKNAVITSHTLKFKKSFRSEKLIADVALVDPLLTISLPPNQTAASGMDALTQLIESYVSKKAKPIPDMLAIGGIQLAGRSLKRAYLEGTDLNAREDMAMASLLSGICLANSGLGAVHGIAAALGSHFGVPHGLACAILLSYVMDINMESNYAKFGDIGRALTGQNIEDNREAARAGVEYIKELSNTLNIPSDFSEYGITHSDLPALAKDSQGNSMSGNPVHLSHEDIICLLKKII